MSPSKQIELLKFLREREEKHNATMTLDGLTKPQIDQIRSWKLLQTLDVYPTSSGHVPSKTLVVYHIHLLPPALEMLEKAEAEPKKVHNPDREL